MDNIPITYQELSNYLSTRPNFNLFELRKQTFLEIEKATGIPLICYVAKTTNIQPSMPVSIDDDDIVGFSDLIYSTDSEDVDIFLLATAVLPFLQKE